MLHLTTGETEEIVVTLTENVTLNPVFYKMVCVHETTGDSVSMVFGEGDDTSYYPDRYNRFVIVTDTHFEEIGRYIYTFYEQAAVDSQTPGGVLEVGILDVRHPEATASPTYEADNSCNVYNPEI